MLEIHLTDKKLYTHTGIRDEKANLDSGSNVEVVYEMEQSGKFTHFEIDHFLDCIMNGTRPITDGPSSLQGLRIIWRLYEAEKNKRIADLQGLGLDQDWRSATK